MSSTVTVVKDKTPAYPCLRKTHGGVIVLFTGRGVGTVVHEENGGGYGLGHQSTNWLMEAFTLLIRL